MSLEVLALIRRPKDTNTEARGQRLANAKTKGQRPADAKVESQRVSDKNKKLRQKNQDLSWRFNR